MGKWLSVAGVGLSAMAGCVAVKSEKHEVARAERYDAPAAARSAAQMEHSRLPIVIDDQLYRVEPGAYRGETTEVRTVEATYDDRYAILDDDSVWTGVTMTQAHRSGIQVAGLQLLPGDEVLAVPYEDGYVLIKPAERRAEPFSFVGYARAVGAIERK